MVVTAVPYLRPGAGLVQAEQWQVLGDEPQALPALLPHWDYNTEVQVGRNVVVDIAAIRHACQFVDDVPLKLVAAWSSPGSFQRGVLCSLCPLPQHEQVVLRGSLNGGDVVSSVRIDTLLLLGASNIDPAPLSPMRAGSVLWRDSATVVVEGTGSRFPIEVIDFDSTAWAPRGAAWFLLWNPFDVDQPFLGAVRLFINASHEQVVRAATTASTESSTVAIRSAIYFDVGRALLRGGLANPDFVADPDGFPRGTTGHAIATLLRTTFPGESVLELRNLLKERPEYFDGVLQAKFNLFQM